MKRDTEKKFEALALVAEEDIDKLYEEAYALLRATKLSTPRRAQQAAQQS